MATTAIWDVKDRLDRVINYATNSDKTENHIYSSPDFKGLQNLLGYTARDDKTEKQFYVTGINCDPSSAYRQMSQTKLQFQKPNGILAFHAYQSFAPGEATPQTAHKIGVNLAKELWGERFEVVVSIHVDKNHLHNHFVLNSVSFIDGKKYYDNNATYALMRQASDRLCKEYSLSVIENPLRGKAKHYAEWQAEKEGKPTWRSLIREDVDKTIAVSMTMSKFISALKKQGYEVKTGVKYMAVRPPGKERFVRLKTLGDEYTEDAIKQRILKKNSPKHQEAVPEPRQKRYKIRGNITPKSKIKLKGLQALYFYYLYKMGILPKKSISKRKTHFLLREDIRHMDVLTAQTKLLCKNRIENKEQLNIYQYDLKQQIKALLETRKSLYNKLRRCSDDMQSNEYKKQISTLSKQLAQLRKEVKLCTGILSRSEDMKQKLLHVKQEETYLRKEEKANDQRSRSSRSNRQYES